MTPVDTAAAVVKIKRGSIKTTLGGIGSILAGAGALCTVLARGNPLGDIEATLGAIGLILTGVALIAARDNNVSDQEAGVRPEVPELPGEIRRALPAHRRGNPAK